MFCRIEFSLAVGLFLEFDHEMPLMSDFPEPRSEGELKERNAKLLRFKQPPNHAIKEECNVKGDLSFPCAPYSKVARMSPQAVAERLKPYVEQWEFISKVEIVNGYLNMFYNREMFFQNFWEGRIYEYVD